MYLFMYIVYELVQKKGYPLNILNPLVHHHS